MPTDGLWLAIVISQHFLCPGHTQLSISNSHLSEKLVYSTEPMNGRLSLLIQHLPDTQLLRIREMIRVGQDPVLWKEGSCCSRGRFDIQDFPGPEFRLLSEQKVC